MIQHTFRAATLAAAVALAFGVADIACAQSAAATTAPAGTTSRSGIDRNGMDPQTRPQDDLFLSMNGDWLKTTEIPADKTSWGIGRQLRDRSDAQVRGIVEALAAKQNPAGSNAQKVADFYRTYVDLAAIDKAGLAPVTASLKEVDALVDARELVVLMAHWQGVVDMPVDVGMGPDFKTPGIYAAAYQQGGLGLPDRDYYLKDDPRFAAARTAYLAYLGKLFKLSGDAQAEAHAAQVMALEKRIATVQWAQDEMRDPVKSYNPMAPAQLEALAPGMAWASFAAGAQLPAGGTVIVMQPSYFTALAGLVKSEPLATWRLYMKARRLDGCATLLPAEFRDAAFEYHGKTLSGLQQPAPRWQDAMHELNGALGEAVGQLYVAQYFPPASRARVQALVGNLLKAYSTSIDGLTWMSPATKAAAHEKLSRYTTKLGYPDAWRDYSALEIRAGDGVGNADRAGMFDYHRQVVRVGQKVERGEWDMTPQTVNAYYNPNMNEVVFPAAILQPPYFNVDADDAVNYGGIGAIIGHEISHGFDDEGSQFDGDGKLRDWWTEGDRKAFEAITSRLVAQYSGYEPLPGQHVNGKLTLGENIADMSGLQISYKAYEISLGGKPSPVIDGLTGEQRFFYGWAQGWRSKMRDASTLKALVTDPHSPARFRADGAAINNDGFHDAFATKPGDTMYKAPADRIRLW